MNKQKRNLFIYFLSSFRYYCFRLIKEVVPAYILDCYMRLIGRKPM